MVIAQTPTLVVSPTSFDYAWDLAFQGKLAETDTAELETADITPRTPAALTPVMHPDFVFSTLLPYHHTLLSHCPS